MLGCLDGMDGIPCYGYGVFREGQCVEIPYPVNQITEKQEVGKSFHHGRFIQNLRKAATATDKYGYTQLFF